MDDKYEWTKINTVLFIIGWPLFGFLIGSMLDSIVGGFILGGLFSAFAARPIPKP